MGKQNKMAMGGQGNGWGEKEIIFLSFIFIHLYVYLCLGACVHMSWDTQGSQKRVSARLIGF